MMKALKLKSLDAVIADVDKVQARHIGVAAQKGHIRALELLWGREVEEYFSLRPTPFTERERQHMRDLLQRYGIDVVNALIPWSIRFWKTVEHAGYMYNLPPTPVFTSFYANRDKFISAKADYDKRQEAEREELRKTKEWVEQPVVKPQKSLLEMFEEERKKLREQKV